MLPISARFDEAHEVQLVKEVQLAQGAMQGLQLPPFLQVPEGQEATVCVREKRSLAYESTPSAQKGMRTEVKYSTIQASC